MDYLTYFNRINYILELITKGQLHSPKDLSEKFDCSEKTVRNMINILRRQGHDIDYCKKMQKYLLLK